MNSKRSQRSARQAARRAITRAASATIEALEKRLLLAAGTTVLDSTVVWDDGTFFDLGNKQPQVNGPVAFPFSDAAADNVVQPNGRVVVAGTTGGNFALARFKTSGALDTTFSGDGKLTTDLGSSTDTAYNVTLLPDGKIVALGKTFDSTTGWHFAATRYTSSGALDTTFGTGGKLETDVGAGPDRGAIVALMSDGSIIVMGGSTPTTFAAKRYESSGEIDPTFGQQQAQAAAFVGPLQKKVAAPLAQPQNSGSPTNRSIAITGPDIVPEDHEFTLGVTSTLPGQEIDSWDIDWGDGQQESGLEEPTHTYATTGEFTVHAIALLDSLKVTNSNTPIPLPSGGDGVVTTPKLIIESGEQFDLKDNALIVTNQSRAELEALIASGFGNFDWHGTGIVSTSADDFNEDNSRALGVIRAGDWGVSEFADQDVSESDVLVRYTWNGDANCDGLVDNDDMGQFLYGFNGGDAMWLNGDFDYNAFVANDDFTLLLAGIDAFDDSGGTQFDQGGDALRLDKVVAPDHTVTVGRNVEIDNFGFEEHVLANPGDSSTNMPDWSFTGTLGSAATTYWPLATEPSAAEGDNVAHLVESTGSGEASIEQVLDETLHADTKYILKVSLAKTANSAAEVTGRATLSAGSYEFPDAGYWVLDSGSYEFELSANSFTTEAAPHVGEDLKIKLWTADTRSLSSPMDVAMDDVRLVAVKIDPVAQLTVTGIAESDEETIGGFVSLNADYDEQLRGPSRDNEPGPYGHAIDWPADTDLLEANLHVDGVLGGNWKLKIPDNVFVWRLDHSQIESEHEYQLTSPLDLDVLIEGIENSSDLRDSTLELTYTHASSESATDKVKLTVSDVDLDIDSNNNNLFAPPDRNQLEELYEGISTPGEEEENGYDYPGKILYVNANRDSDGDSIFDWRDGYDQDATDTNDNTSGDVKFVPLPLLVQPPFDPSTAKFKFTYVASDPLAATETEPAEGPLRIWLKPGNVARDGRSVDDEGDFVAPGVAYTGAELGFDENIFEANLWLEAVAETSDVNDGRHIVVQVDPDGDGPAGFVLADSVYARATTAAEQAVISGYKWNDRNGNGIRDKQFIAGSPPDLVYVIDVSKSTIEKQFEGSSVGDVNSDGMSDRILDGELAAFIATTKKLALLDEVGKLGIVVFASESKIIDLNAATGMQSTIAADADIDNDDVLDVVEVLQQISQGEDGVGNGTNYKLGLEKTLDVVQDLGLPGINTNVLFLSDGYPNSDDYVEDAIRLRESPYSVLRVIARGAGDQARLDTLLKIDPGAKIFHTATELVNEFGDLDEGGGSFTEEGVAGWKIFVDTNNNGPDGNDPWTLTDEAGNYSITVTPPLAGASYTVYEEMRQGWVQTYPGNSDDPQSQTTIKLYGGQIDPAIHFGNVATALPSQPDLDIDSDNTDGFSPPERNELEDQLESLVTADGKFIPINTDNTDNDANDDFFDFNEIIGEQFVPLVLDLSAFDSIANAEITFVYDGSDPEDATAEDPATGTLRIWTKPGDQERSFSTYITPGSQYTAAELGMGDSLKTRTLWVEAVREAAADSQRLIQVNVNPDTTANGDAVTDSVYVRPRSAVAGSVSGFIFDDKDEDGERDFDEGSGIFTEPPAEGVRVYVDLNGNQRFSPDEPSATTEADGNYSIANVPAGEYTLRVNELGLGVTKPTTPLFHVHSISISAGHNENDKDFGVHFNGVEEVFITQAPPGDIDEGNLASFHATLGNASALSYKFFWSATLIGATEQRAIPFDPVKDVFSNPASSLLTLRLPDNGECQVTVVVFDNDGTAVGRKTVSAHVNNISPTGEIELVNGTSFGVSSPGNNVVLVAQANDPASWDDHFTYTWSFTLDGAPFTPPSTLDLTRGYLSFELTDPGVYRASCTVQDDDGGSVLLSSGPFVMGSGSGSVGGTVYYDTFSPPVLGRDPALAGYRVYDDADDSETFDAPETFTDSNNNGQWDTGEPFEDLNGDLQWTSGENFSITSNAGEYVLHGLSAGEYSIRVELEDLAWATDPEDGVASVMLPEDTAPVDFGIHPQLEILTEPAETYKWNPYAHRLDTLSDPLWDPGDLLVNGPAKVGGYTQYLVRRSDLLSQPANVSFDQTKLVKIGPNNIANGNLEIDGQGGLLLTDYKNHRVNRVAPDGATLTTDFIELRGAEDVRVDAAGNIYVSANAFFTSQPSNIDQRASGIYKFDKDGSLLARLAAGIRVDQFDVAPDQHSIVFTIDEQRIFKLDTNTGALQKIASLNTPFSQGISVAAPDPNDSSTWRIIVACAKDVQILNWDGALIRTIAPLPDKFYWNDIALTGTAPYFWVTGDPANAVQYNWETGELVRSAPIDDKFYAAFGAAVFRPNAGTGEVGELYTYHAHATSKTIDDNPKNRHVRGDIRYELVADENPPGATIDPVTGLVEWKPTAPGTYSFHVHAWEVDHLSETGMNPDSRTHADQEWNVVVESSGPNSSPAIIAQTLSSGKVGRHYTGIVKASDADGDQLAYSITGGAGGKIDPLSGVFSFMPSSAGNAIFTIQVEDGRGGVADAEITIHVDEPINPSTNNPTISGVSDSYTRGAGELLTIDDIGLSDPDPEDRYTLTLRAANKPNGLVVTQESTWDGDLETSGFVSWRPKRSDVRAEPYTVTLELTDGRGGIVTKTFTIVVTATTALSDVIGDVAILPGDDPLRQKKLAVQTFDPETLVAAQFAWECTDLPDGATMPDIRGLVNNSSVDVTFFSSGTYKFTVTASLDNHEYTFEKEVIVDPVISRVAPVVRSIVAAPAQSVSWLRAGAFDQFNGLVTSGENSTWKFRWSIVDNDPDAGEIDPDTGEFDPGSAGEYAIKVAAIGIPGNNELASSTIRVRVTSDAAQFGGEIAQGVRAIETRHAMFDASSGADNFLGAFFDTREASGDYEVLIDWGDGTVSTGQLVSVSESGLPYAPDGVDDYYFVKSEHTYGLQGKYALKIIITPDVGDVLILQSKDDEKIYVDSTPLNGEPAPIAAINGREFSGVIARFSDPGPLSDASRFSADIEWGDGSEIAPEFRGLLGGYLIRTVSPGNYEVTSSHTFFGTGRPKGKITIYENVQEIQPGLWSNGLQIPLDIVVGATDLTPPTEVVADDLAADVIQISWKHNSQAYGHRITRIEFEDDGVTEVLPHVILPDENLVTTSEPYTDIELDPDHKYQYIVTSVDPYGNESDPSERSNIVETPRTLEVAPPDELTASHLIVTDPDTNVREEGIQLFWKPDPAQSAGYGYKVARRVGSSGDFTDLIDADHFIDPTDVQLDGRIAFFDDFGAAKPFANDESSYEYKVYAIDSKSHEIAGGSDTVPVTKDQTPPLVPENLRAAGYPDVIQLSWDDRATDETNGDWAGWNVYRKVGDGDWIRINADPIFEETGFYDFDVDPNVAYIYRIAAIDVFGNASSTSNEVTHSISDHGEPPSPTSLTAIPTSDTTIDLDWADVSPTVGMDHETDALDHYNIYRSTDAVITADDRLELTTTVSAFPDSELSESTTYWYGVSAVDGDGDESALTIVSAHTGDGMLPDSPTSLDVTTKTESRLTLIWTTVTGVAGYRLYHATSSSGPYELVSGSELISQSTNTFIDENLDPGIEYHYQLYAVDSDGDFSDAATTSDTTEPIESERPKVGIISPINDDISSSATPVLIDVDENVVGYVFDRNTDANQDLDHWRLVLRPAEAADAQADYLISKGSEKLGRVDQPATLGRIRATMVPNGIYRLLLLAYDNTGVEESANEAIKDAGLFEIKTEVKVGAFTLPVVDLQVDGASGQSITVTRVYDSSRANEKGDFGYGWRLELNETNYRTTARESSSGSRSSEGAADERTLRFGDLVYVTIPGRGQHVFAFTPRPTNYDPSLSADPMSWIYIGAAYAPQFVAVDGSNAVLTVPRDGGDDADPFFMRYDRENKEFFVENEFGQLLYNPANRNLGSDLRVLEPDGTKYFINAQSGDLKYSIDARGHQTNYGDNAADGELRVDVHRNGVLIDKIRVINSAGEQIGEDVEYDYDEIDNLEFVTGRDAQVTTYKYEDAKRPHHMTSVLDARDVEQIHASYSEKTGELLAAKDALGNVAQIGTGSFSGSTVRSTVTDLDKQETQIVQDNHGNVIREIRRVKNTSGEVTKILLTLHEYGYENNDDFGQTMNFGVSSSNALTGVTHYQTYELSGDATLDEIDDAFKDETQTQAKAVVTSSMTFYGFDEAKFATAFGRSDYVRNAIDPDFRQLASQTVFDHNDQPRTTIYSHYKLGKAQKITDPDGNVTYFKYDDEGLLEWNANALGEGTQYEYLDASDLLSGGEGFEGLGINTGNPGGLVAKTFSVIIDNAAAVIEDGDPADIAYVVEASGDINPASADGNSVTVTAPVAGLVAGMYVSIGNESYKVARYTVGNGQVELAEALRADVSAGPVTFVRPTQVNTYYNNSAPNGSRWKLRSTTDASGVTTFFAYDAGGRQAISARLSQPLGANPAEPDFNSDTGFKWIVSETLYDETGRGVETRESVYTDINSYYPNSSPQGIPYSYHRELGWHLTLDDDGNSRIAIDETPATELEFAPRTLSTTTYDAIGKVWQSEDEYDGITENHYDDRGNLVETIYPDDTKTVQLYDVAGRVILSVNRYAFGETDPIVATRTIYDTQGRVSESQRIQLAPADIVVSSTGTGDAKVYRVTTAANVGLETHHVGAWWSISATAPTHLLSTSKTVYDSLGRVVETVNADGLRTGTIYFPNGQVQYTGPLNEVHVEGAAFDVEDFESKTTYDYHLTNDLPDGAISYDVLIDALDHETKTYKDALGRVIKTMFEDDSFTETAYEPLGRVVHKTAQRKTGDPAITTDYTYDIAGRLTDVDLPAVDDALTESTETVQPHWHYVYDVNGNQHSQVDPKNHVVTFAYDEFNRRVSRIVPNSGSEEWTYDSRGRTDTHTDFKDQTTTFVYDNTTARGGRLMEEHRAGDGISERTVYTYDALGRRDSVTEFQTVGEGDEDQTRETIYAYDPISGNVSQVVSPEGTINYQYFESTGRLQETFTASNDSLYEYDEFGRLKTVTSETLNGDNVHLETHYTYDAVGNLETVEQPNGVSTTYGYDELNRLKTLIVTNSDDVKLFDQTYTLLHNGQRDYVIENRYDGIDDSTPTSTVKIDWEYDALDRLTSEVRDEGNDNVVNGNHYTDTYTFDLASNRITKTHDDSGGSQTLTYRYNESDQLTKEGVDTDDNGDPDTNVTNYGYDLNGSLTSKGSATFTWDLRNRMSRATVGGIATDYTYDDNGVRVGKSSGTSTTHYLIDANNPTNYAKPIEERDESDALVRSYVFGQRIEGQADDTSAVLWFIADGHGSTRAVIDSSGAIVQQYELTAFQESIGFDFADAKTSWIAPDGATDVETNLTYSLARYRDGWRFVSQDPGWEIAGDPAAPATLHNYLYANADPVSMIDASGNMTLPEFLTVTGIVLNILNLALDGAHYSQAVARNNTSDAVAALGWLTFDTIMLLVPFSGGPKAGFQVVVTGYRSIVSAQAARTLLSQAAFTFGLVHFAWNVAEHKRQPSPHPGEASHHGVISVWMEAHYPGYNRNRAPTILLPERNHFKTSGVLNVWRAKMAQQMGGRFDWMKVSESEIRALSEEMFEAAEVPQEVRTQYWEWFERMKTGLEQ